MRSSRRRSTPACGEGIQGNSLVAITTRCAKSALTSSFDIEASSEAFGERAQVHLVGPRRRILRGKLEAGPCDGLRRHPRCGRRAKTLLSLHLVDQAVEHEV